MVKSLRSMLLINLYLLMITLERLNFTSEIIGVNGQEYLLHNFIQYITHTRYEYGCIFELKNKIQFKAHFLPRNIGCNISIPSIICLQPNILSECIICSYTECILICKRRTFS